MYMVAPENETFVGVARTVGGDRRSADVMNVHLFDGHELAWIPV